jgi:hypothetical protein
MSRLNPTHPALCLQGEIETVIDLDLYTDNDDSGLYNRYVSYLISIKGVSSQTISDMSTRLPGQYNAIDVKAGDYITDTTGEIVLKIKRIIAKTDYTFEFEAEDVDGITFRQYGLNKPSAGSEIIIFELSENGLPVFVGDPILRFAENAIDKIQSRFSIDEDDERFRFYHEISPNVNIGEIVTVDINGNIVKFGNTGAATTPVGTVLSKSHSGKIIYVKPFNKIIDNFPDPTILTGEPGDMYYTDLDNPGGITTTKSGNSKAVYLHLTDPTSTIITSTSATALPGDDDIVKLNNITVFNGPDGDAVSNAVQLSQLINTFSSQTYVTSSAEVEPVVSQTDPALLLQNAGAVLSVVTTNGTNPSPTFQYVEATFSDGSNSVTIQFDPTTYNITPQPFANSVPDYLVLDAAAMIQIMNTEFQNSGLNLIASIIPAPEGSQMTDLYDAIKITATTNSASINITNISTDAFGSNFAGTSSNSGLILNTPAGTDAFLTLTRADGGDILITGGTSIDGTSDNIVDGVGYINSNGLCSSSTGNPAILLMVEGSTEDIATDVGVVLNNDYDMSPNQTNGNYSPTGLTITNTPFLGSKIEVRINGIDANIGEANDYSQKSCYFSPDGFIIRDFVDIVAGDELYWNGALVGFDLDQDDDVDFIYQTSSTNS